MGEMRETLLKAVTKDACWQGREDCHCDHAAGAESAFDYLEKHGHIISPQVVALVEAAIGMINATKMQALMGDAVTAVKRDDLLAALQPFTTGASDE